MSEPMTPDEFKQQMQIILDPARYMLRDDALYGGDDHELADKLVAKLLIQLGYSEGAILFRDMHKWYE